MTDLAIVLGFAFCFLSGLSLGGLWGTDKLIKEKVATLRSLDAIAKDYLKSLRKIKHLSSQIKGFYKTGDELLSLTVKLLESLDKNKLRIIRNFRGQLKWAEKHLEKQK